MMKKYFLDIKFGRDTKIDIDKAPDVTTEELEKVLVELRKIFEKAEHNFKFRMVDQRYVSDFCNFLNIELRNVGIVVRIEQIAQFEICVAFMA